MVGAASPSTTWGSTWEPTILYDVMPVSQYYDYVRNKPYRVIFRKELEPVFTPFAKLGMEKVSGENWHYMTPRQGSVTWADMQPNNNPWLGCMSAHVTDPCRGVIWCQFAPYTFSMPSFAKGVNTGSSSFLKITR